MARPREIEALIHAAATTPPPAAILAHAGEIDRLFARASVEDVLAALEADKSDWSQAQLGTLRKKSPQSCKVSLRLVREIGPRPAVADEMRAEYGVAVHVCQRPDFREGVRALLVDRDNRPVWDPASPEAVTEHMIDTIFAPLPNGEAWSPLGR
jgi:enoyl-CoA hydratase